MTRWETTSTRIVVALAAGSLVGGLLSAVTLFGSIILSRPAADWLGIVAISGAVAVTGFAMGLCLLAGPAWLLMHQSGLRRWFWGPSLGLTLGAVVGGLLALTAGPGQTWASATLPTGGLAAICGLVGLLIWRIAYRRSREPGQAI